MDYPLQTFAATPPKQTAFKEGTAEHPEMTLYELLARLRAEFGKTQFEVGSHHVPALAAQKREQAAKHISDSGERRQWQEMQQPEQGNGGLAQELA
ncbi:hypothetical protein AGMMS50256_04610 [Betaproteobacteria bacterium]|nr:hypothetical protein AGMMS50256_04610 [Betaproteobacteria bacterium]